MTSNKIRRWLAGLLFLVLWLTGGHRQDTTQCITSARILPCLKNT